jgi:hypothetical protein
MSYMRSLTNEAVKIFGIAIAPFAPDSAHTHNHPCASCVGYAIAQDLGLARCWVSSSGVWDWGILVQLPNECYLKRLSSEVYLSLLKQIF